MESHCQESQLQSESHDRFQQVFILHLSTNMCYLGYNDICLRNCSSNLFNILAFYSPFSINSLILAISRFSSKKISYKVDFSFRSYVAYDEYSIHLCCPRGSSHKWQHSTACHYYTNGKVFI